MHSFLHILVNIFASWAAHIVKIAVQIHVSLFLIFAISLSLVWTVHALVPATQQLRSIKNSFVSSASHMGMLPGSFSILGEEICLKAITNAG